MFQKKPAGPMLALAVSARGRDGGVPPAGSLGTHSIGFRRGTRSILFASPEHLAAIASFNPHTALAETEAARESDRARRRVGSSEERRREDPTGGCVPRGTSHPVMAVRLAEMFHWTDGGGANSEGGDANTARGVALPTGMWDLSARQRADGPLSHVARAASATDPGLGLGSHF